MSRTTPKIGISRGPGGLPGLDAHVGAWLAFDEAGIRPTHVYGCSAGAAISALQAAGRNAAGVERTIRGLRTEDVVRKRRLWHARAFWLSHFCDPEPIEQLLRELLPLSFEELELPLAVSATAMGQYGAWAQVLSAENCPSVRRAVQASMAIAGVWPYVDILGTPYSDGGTTDAIVLPRADELAEFDRFFVLNCRRRRSFEDRDRNVLSRLMWTAEQLGEYERRATRQRLAYSPNVIWLDLPIPETASCLAFDHDIIESVRGSVAQNLALARGLIEPDPLPTII